MAVVSGDPYILNNLIERNFTNGVSCSSYDNMRCDGKLRNNEILGNVENGVEVVGETSFTKVLANHKIESNVIMHNLKAGVRCKQGADVSIFQNKIGTFAEKART